MHALPKCSSSQVTQVWPMKCKWKWDRLELGRLYSRNKIQRHCKRPKIAPCMWSWSNYKQDTNRLQIYHFWGAESKSRVLHVIPTHCTTKAVNRPLKPALWPNPLTHPTLIGFKEPVCTPPSSNKRPCFRSLVLQHMSRESLAWTPRLAF